ncbi:MAG: DUF5317 family protein [Chloroflexota bacterium]
MNMLRETALARRSTGVRDPWAFIVALVVQLVAVHGFPSLPPTAMKAVLAFSYGLVCVGVIRNWRWWGIRLIGLGVALNLVVMVANGGLMPVSPETVARAGLEGRIAQAQLGGYIPGSKSLLQAASAIRLEWLSDSIPMRLIHRVVSPGDMVIVFGFLFFLVEAFRSRPWAKPKAFDGNR